MAVDYWGMTLQEIMTQLSANRKRTEVEMKNKAMFDYKQAQLMMFAFNKPDAMPVAEKMYPFLSESNLSESNNSKQNKQIDEELELKIAKQRMLQVAERFKKNREIRTQYKK